MVKGPSGFATGWLFAVYDGQANAFFRSPTVLQGLCIWLTRASMTYAEAVFFGLLLNLDQA